MDEDPEKIHHSELVVDEIRETPAGRDERHLEEEYVTFRNDGMEPLDISGWTVENEAGTTFHFPKETVLAPGKRVTLHSGESGEHEMDLYWGANRPVWRNTGDTVFVRDADGVLRIRESYGE